MPVWGLANPRSVRHLYLVSVYAIHAECGERSVGVAGIAGNADNIVFGYQMVEDRFSILVGHTVERNKDRLAQILADLQRNRYPVLQQFYPLDLSSRTADRTITQTISKVRKSDELVIDGIRGDSFI